MMYLIDSSYVIFFYALGYST